MFRRVTLLAAACTALVVVVAPSAQAARFISGPLETAFVDPFAFPYPTIAPTAFAGARGLGATKARITITWSAYAPQGPTRPPGFNPTDPGDPHYAWQALDQQVTDAVTAGLQPIIGFSNAPQWAERGTVGDPGSRDPDPAAIAQFARAVAERFSGRFAGLPRVRYFQVWNEPNLDWFYMPQFASDGVTELSTTWYREVVNAAYAQIHAVNADNVVVVGGLTPTGDGTRAMWPMRFLRTLLCMSADPVPQPTCGAQVKFDAWAHHPYSYGSPDWSTGHPDGGTIRDLPRMRALLQAAIAHGRLVPDGDVRFWVTEFSWDTNGPDPYGVPQALHQRWVAEALYKMWSAGVSLVTWFTVRDNPMDSSFAGWFQSGLYAWDGDAYGVSQPKSSAWAFKFPVVAYSRGARLTVWGRTPTGGPAYVVIQRNSAAGWTRLVRLRADRYGIFRGRVRAGVGGDLIRGVFVPTGEGSIPFSLSPPPEHLLQTPFGEAR